MKRKTSENERAGSDAGEVNEQEVSQQNMAIVAAALEPGQLASAKARSHCARRQLTRTEKLLFWALRVYLIFTLGVVMYQIWTVAR
jgi:hypothetical protein